MEWSKAPKEAVRQRLIDVGVVFVEKPEPVLDDITRWALIDAYKGICQYCGAGEADEIDHIVPRARGGKNFYDNLTLSCLECNRSKGARRLRPDHERRLIFEAEMMIPFIAAAKFNKQFVRRLGRRTETISVRVTLDVYHQLRDICDAREYGYSEWLDEALEAWEQVKGLD